MSSQSSEQGAPKLLPCPFCGNKAEHRNTWVWCTNVSCRAHTAGFKPAEWNTRSDICAALVEALERLADAYFTFGEALVELPNQPLLPKAVEAEYSALIDAAFAARTAIAQAREEK